MKYKGLVVREEKEEFRAAIEDLDIANLPDHDVLIRVTHAALNFKDALSTKGHKGITRNYPHTPGVDAAGIVVEDRSNHFKPGQKVICTSFDLGMNTAGGFGEYIRVPSHWVVPLPEEMSLKESMILGTAAYTAGLAIHKMEQCGQKPELGEIVVTGASGGVGSMAVALLNRVGYDVLASTGKSTAKKWTYPRKKTSSIANSLFDTL